MEASAILHGVSVATFIQHAALETADITPYRKGTKGAALDPNDTGALWLTGDFEAAPESEADLFAPVDAPAEVEVAPSAAAPAKKGVAGERSKLAKGHGLVWEIRQALGWERVHGLGWTREPLAFVLKLSVVGAGKMEHLGTSPVKSLEARQRLLGLAKTLENPGGEIAAYIEAEEAELG